MNSDVKSQKKKFEDAEKKRIEDKIKLHNKAIKEVQEGIQQTLFNNCKGVKT